MSGIPIYDKGCLDLSELQLLEFFEQTKPPKFRHQGETSSISALALPFGGIKYTTLKHAWTMKLADIGYICKSASMVALYYPNESKVRAMSVELDNSVPNSLQLPNQVHPLKCV